VTSEGESSFIWEAGGQFRFYLLGSFAHGLMLGADSGYAYVNPEFGDYLWGRTDDTTELQTLLGLKVGWSF
jgi:hypothetical protein